MHPIDIPTEARSLPRRSAGLVLALAIATVAACAPRARAESAPATPAPSRDETGATPSGTSSAPPTTAAPMTQQRVARALDPEPGPDPCGGYTFDGVALGMARKALESSFPLVPLKREESLIEGYQDRTVGFRAARPGRIDDVQLALTAGSAPVVVYLFAQVLVVDEDAWPRTLFDRLGTPKNARLGEWIWWDQRCGSTLRLTQVETLGGGRGRSYTLELRHTLKPAE